MTNCYASLMDAVATGDDTHRAQFASDSGTTMVMAISLMQLQAAWMGQLENDRIEFIIASLNPSPAAAGIAKSLQIDYETNSTKKDTQCGALQATVKSMQTQISMDSDSRQQGFRVLEGMNGALSFINSLIKQKI